MYFCKFSEMNKKENLWGSIDSKLLNRGSFNIWDTQSLSCPWEKIPQLVIKIMSKVKENVTDFVLNNGFGALLAMWESDYFCPITFINFIFYF